MHKKREEEERERKRKGIQFTKAELNRILTKRVIFSERRDKRYVETCAFISETHSKDTTNFEKKHCKCIPLKGTPSR